MAKNITVTKRYVARGLTPANFQLVQISGGGGGGSDLSNYYTKTEADALYVHLTGNETIAGIKTFSSNPVLSADSAILSFSSATGVKKITTGGSTYLGLVPGGGRVGINKDAPNAALDVDGDIITYGGNVHGGAFCWGIDTTEETTPNSRESYVMSHHKGFSLSAHSYYGGVRIYNQEAEGPYGYNGTMVVAVTDGKVGVLKTDPSEALDVTGNILLSGYVKGDNLKSNSVSFVSGFSGAGYQLDKSGSDYELTLDNLTVRKAMKIYELIIQKIRAIGGSFWVSECHRLETVTPMEGEYICTIDTDDGNLFVEFEVGDIVRCQAWTGRGVKYYTAEVTYVFVGEFSIKVIDGVDAPTAGDEVVRIGSNASSGDRSGSIYMTSSDDNAPYIDVMDEVVDENFAGKVKVRMGRLDGINDPDLGNLSGYGLYGGNVYLKGKIVAESGLVGGFTIDSTEGIYAGTGATRVQMKVGAGFWTGATAIGDAPFSVTNAGVLTAESGTIGGWTLDTDAIYTGTKKTTEGYTTSGITLASNGSLRSKFFEIKETGYAQFQSVDSIFKATNVPIGDLDGTLVATQANAVNTKRKDQIVLSGSSGEADVTCNGTSQGIVFTTDLATTAANFVTDYAENYLVGGVVLTSIGGTLYFEAETAGIDFSGATSITNLNPNLDGVVTTTQVNIVAAKRIDTITMEGTAGTATIVCDGNTTTAVWNDAGLSAVATDYVNTYWSTFDNSGVALTSSGADIIFTAKVAGVDFSGATSIVNLPNPWRGSVKIHGNEIWENDEDNDAYGYLCINRKGYNGGTSRYRNLLIGNGKGSWLSIISGDANEISTIGHHSMFAINVERFIVWGIPTSSSGLPIGAVYRDGSNYLRIV